MIQQEDTARECLPMGDMDSWAVRYGSAEVKGSRRQGAWSLGAATVSDVWSQGSVQLHAAMMAPVAEVSQKDTPSGTSNTNGGLSARDRTRFLERAKLLRRCDHAHIEPVLDYFLNGDELLWVTPVRQVQALDDRLAQGPLAPGTALHLLGQYISVVSYFETQAPHIVPTLAAGTALSIDEKGALYVRDYQSQFLLTDESVNSFKAIAELMCHIGNHLPEAEATRSSLLEIAMELTGAKQPPHLSSLHKIRNTLKHIEERCSI
jgi:hypothetical protein